MRIFQIWRWRLVAIFLLAGVIASFLKMEVVRSKSGHGTSAAKRLPVTQEATEKTGTWFVSGQETGRLGFTGKTAVRPPNAADEVQGILPSLAPPSEAYGELETVYRRSESIVTVASSSG